MCLQAGKTAVEVTTNEEIKQLLSTFMENVVEVADGTVSEESITEQVELRSYLSFPAMLTVQYCFASQFQCRRI